MTRLEHGVVIHCPLNEVYALAADVERYPEFLPGYRESRIVQRDGSAVLLERAAQIRGQLLRWKSWAFFERPHRITFRQCEGPLQGMQVTWDFESLGLDQTRVLITHRFAVRRPFLWGYALEKWLFKPRLDEIASAVVVALKTVCEVRKETVAV